MTTPAIQEDVWKRADIDDWRRALALLDRLPSRVTSSAALDQQAFFIALEGTTQYGLFTAVSAILKNSLGHAFHPSPPELRGECDRAMYWHERERERIQREERIRQENIRQSGNWRPPTPEEKTRAAHVYANFCKGYEKVSAEDTLTLDPELVAQIPDNPKSVARQRMGK